MEIRLKELGQQAEVEVYPGADLILCADRASYHAEVAKDVST